MRVAFIPHALGRAEQRGCTRAEIEQTLRVGERFPAKFGRTGFRLRLPGEWHWRGRLFDPKEIEAYAAPENDGWVVITVIARFW